MGEMSEKTVEFRLRRGGVGVRGRQSSAKGPLFALSSVYLCVKLCHPPRRLTKSLARKPESLTGHFATSQRNLSTSSKSNQESFRGIMAMQVRKLQFWGVCRCISVWPESAL